MKPRHLLPLLAGLSLGFVTATAAVETYGIDPAHSSVGFVVRHLVSKVPGSFTQFTGTLVIDRDHLERSTAEATIQIGSVTTGTERRDAHLKSPDFFDAAKFATMTFKSKAWKQTGEDSFDITGDLTIRDVTKEVVLHAKLLGFSPGMQPGSQVTGWEATTKLNRRDFGVNGPAMLGAAVGDEVTVNLTVEAVLKK
jgi:polyisoprenoid-binding protein YceI